MLSPWREKQTRGIRRMRRCPSHVNSLGRLRTFNFDGRHADAIAILQKEPLRSRLTVHPDQKISRFAMLHPVFEELRNRASLRYFDCVSEAAAVVVDVKNLHAKHSLPI